METQLVEWKCTKMPARDQINRHIKNCYYYKKENQQHL